MSHIVKRKADELDDSDEEEEPMLGRQVLPVANLPDTFDGVPADGMQYLFTVRRDARLLPHITRVANPYEFPEVPPPSALPTIASHEGSGARSAAVLPSEEWRETFLRRFKNFRKARPLPLYYCTPRTNSYAARPITMLSTIQNSVQPTIHVHIPDSSRKLIPDKKERDLWWAFLAGRPESEWNPPKKPKQPKLSRWQQRNLMRGPGVVEEGPDYASLPYDVGESSYVVPETSTALPNPIPSSTASSLSYPHPTPGGNEVFPAQVPSNPVPGTPDAQLLCSPREPTPALLQQVDHKYAMHLLMYFGHWINLRLEEGSLPYTDLTQAHARWIFSLLSRVEDWISGDETSLLRTVARGCMGLMAEGRRSGLADMEADAGKTPQNLALMDERSCWMIITAITGLWGQTDLWMDAESMLSEVIPAAV